MLYCTIILLCLLICIVFGKLCCVWILLCSVSIILCCVSINVCCVYIIPFCVWKSVCCVPGIYVVVFEEQFVVFADVGHRRSGTPLRTKCSKFLPLLSNTDHQ